MKAVDFSSVEIGSVRSRVDGSISFTIITPEMGADAVAAIIGLHGKNARCLLVPKDVEADEMISVKGDAEIKTPSQRLRAVLFIWHQQQPQPKTSFEVFYAEKMNALIEHVKSKLNP